MEILSTRMNAPGTSRRIPHNTPARFNSKIRQKTLRRLDEIGYDSIKIEMRLWEIEKEWDIERTLEAHVAAVTLVGVTLGATVNRKWFALPAFVAGFLMQHAVQGWCPPLPIFRFLGIRTQREIDNERAILLARKGVIDNLRRLPSGSALDVLEEN